MRRIIFYLMLVASIIGSVCVVLFVPQFWQINGHGGGGNGWDALFGNRYSFLPTLFRGDWVFAWNSGHALIYAVTFFFLICALTLLILVLLLLINGLRLGRSSRLYRNCSWFMFAALVLTAFYIWYSIDMAGGDWSINTLPWAFYVPLGTALVTTIMGGVMRITEKD